MRFKPHWELRDKHAFLSPSNYHWVNYDDQKLKARYSAHRAARRGTDLHDLARRAIELGVKLSETNEALHLYVNDGIEYKMSCEVTLMYSENCFGTADTICFWDNLLRIHDLKTGINAVSFKQNEVYAALFCLEYGYDPRDIGIELRIYQREEVRYHEPYAETIQEIMDKIVDSDRRIEEMKQSEYWIGGG